MTELHVAALALAALALLSAFTAGAPGPLAAAIILAAAAAKGVTVLRYFLRLDRATLGWRIALAGFVTLVCAVSGGLYLAGLMLAA
ncbi:cytochrome C oxidase subunit IV family protein [Stappia sp. F7233]|uniref:Cytochrome C oxidase subunit IV family protein n=1 Tax=Stappia albiluteola TaxID=2758565 RepID=A0A839A8M6_9HYPH|nr:cytochrome C oxidase subunit IV family protein [Stappia albiluteola]MBA5775681.1 cytochrome C oxidase subunit IV family protein [Stappia albiluteola]